MNSALMVFNQWSFSVEDGHKCPVESAALAMASCPFADKIDSYVPFIRKYPGVFLYNNWKTITNILKKADSLGKYHFMKGIAGGWLKGCCNFPHTDLQPYKGKVFIVNEIEPIVEECTINCYTASISGLKLDCIRKDGYITIYANSPNQTLATSSTSKVQFMSNVCKNLRLFNDMGSFTVLKNNGHTYYVKELLDLLVGGKSFSIIDKPPRVYSGLTLSLCNNNLLLENDKIIDTIDLKSERSLGQMGNHLVLSEKYDAKTASILMQHCEMYWFNNVESFKTSINFLIQRRTTRLGHEIKPAGNWKRKRYLADVSYLLFAQGYPRLWNYDKNVRPTELCYEFLTICKTEIRDCRVFVYKSGSTEKFREELAKLKLTKSHLTVCLAAHKKVVGLSTQNKMAFPDRRSEKAVDACKLDIPKEVCVSKKKFISDCDKSYRDILLKEKMVKKILKDRPNVLSEIKRENLIKSSIRNCDSNEQLVRNEISRSREKNNSDGGKEKGRERQYKVHLKKGNDVFKLPLCNYYEALGKCKEETKSLLDNVNLSSSVIDKIVDYKYAEYIINKRKYATKKRKELAWSDPVGENMCKKGNDLTYRHRWQKSITLRREYVKKSLKPRDANSYFHPMNYIKEFYEQNINFSLKKYKFYKLHHAVTKEKEVLFMMPRLELSEDEPKTQPDFQEVNERRLMICWRPEEKVESSTIKNKALSAREKKINEMKLISKALKEKKKIARDKQKAWVESVTGPNYQYH